VVAPTVLIIRFAPIAAAIAVGINADANREVSKRTV